MNPIAQRYPRLRSDPDAALILQFSPADLREQLAPVMALQRELLAMPDEISEPEVLQAKLGWWLQELTACAQQKAASHPLTQEIQQAQSDFAWAGWQQAAASLLQQAGEAASASQAQLRDLRIAQGGAIWQSWLLGDQADPSPTLAGQGAMLQLVEVMRRDRGKLAWIGLDRLARYQRRRSDLQAVIAGDQIDPECSSLLRELADEWLSECDRLLAAPASQAQAPAAVLAMQFKLAQLWLRTLRRKPAAFLRGQARPTLFRRLHAVWRVAGQQRRRQPD